MTVKITTSLDDKGVASGLKSIAGELNTLKKNAQETSRAISEAGKAGATAGSNELKQKTADYARLSAEIERMAGATSKAAQIERNYQIEAAKAKNQMYAAEAAARGGGGGSVGGGHGGGGGGSFTQLANQINATNITRGHEFQFRSVAGMLDNMPAQAARAALALGGVGIAAYAGVKGLDALAASGSKGAKEIQQRFAEIGTQIGLEIEAGAKRAAGAFDTLYEHAKATMQAIGLVSQDTGSGAMLRQRGIAETDAAQRQALARERDARIAANRRDSGLASADFERGQATSTRMRGIGNLTSDSELNSLLSKSRGQYDAMVSRNSVRKADLAGENDRSAEKAATLKAMQEEAQTKLAGLAGLPEDVPGQTESTTKRRVDLEKLIITFKEQQAALSSQIVENNKTIAKLTADESAALKEQEVIQSRQLSLMHEQRELTKSRREDERAMLEESRRARRQMEQSVAAAGMDFFKATQQERQSLLAQDRDREFKHLQEGRQARTATDAEREAAARRLLGFTGNIKKIEEQTYKTQTDEIAATRQRHVNEMETQKNLKEQAKTEEDAAKTVEKRTEAHKKYLEALEKEKALRAEIRGDDQRAQALEAQHALAMQRLDQQHAALMRADVQAEMDRQRERGENYKKDVLGQTNAGLTGGDAGGLFGQFKSGLNQSAILRQIADQRAQAARGNLKGAAGDRAAARARTGFYSELRRGGPNTDGMISKRRRDAMADLRRDQAKAAKKFKGTGAERREMLRRQRQEMQAAGRADYTKKGVGDDGLQESEVAKAQQSLLEKQAQLGAASGKFDQTAINIMVDQLKALQDQIGAKNEAQQRLTNIENALQQLLDRANAQQPNSVRQRAQGSNVP